MMNKMKIAGLVGSALLLCGTQAQAEITWTFKSPTGDSSTSGNTITKTGSGSGVTATAQAWANTNDGLGSSSKGSSDPTTAASYKLETAYLNVYSGGLGVKNQDFTTDSTSGDLNEGLTSPAPAEHSTDNNQRYDSVLFSFSDAIDLNSVTIGWKDVDSDITVLAYTPSAGCVACTSNVSGKTYANLTSYGWSVIGHYSNLINNDAMSVNAGNVTSSYWLVGAYNPLVGNSQGWTTGNDYVKLAALSGTYTPPQPNGNPEPGTLLLMGAGLFGLTRFKARCPARSAA